MAGPTAASLLIGFSASWVALGEMAHHVVIPPGVSLNLLLTAAYFVYLVVVVLAQGRHSAVAVIVVIGSGLHVVLALGQGIGLRHTQYLITVSCLILGVLLLLDERVAHRLRQIYWGAAMISAAVFAVDIVVDFEWIGRAHAVVGALAIGVLLVMGMGARSSVRIAGYLASAVILLSLTLDTSRMATAIATVILLAYIAIAPGLNLLQRVPVAIGLVSLELAYWLMNANAHERLVGRDASVVVGPLVLNGEGRTAAAEVALTPAGAGDDGGIFALVFGSGVGRAGQRLVDAGFPLDKPHNEFIRAFVDLGVVGCIAGGLAALWIVVLGIRLWRRKGFTAEALLVGVVALVLMGFAYSDNVLSYSWILIPCGILLAWARRPLGSNEAQHSAGFGRATKDSYDRSEIDARALP